VGFVQHLGLLPKNNIYFLPEAYRLYRDRASEASTADFRKTNESRSVSIHFLGVWDTVGSLGIPGKVFTRLYGKKYQFHDVSLAPCVKTAYHALAIDERRKNFAPSIWDHPLEEHQTLVQTWFAGVHTNIGGGYDKDGLANIPLHWIVDAAKERGLAVDEDYLGHYKPWFGHRLYDSKKGIFRFLGSHERQIGATKYGNESVHETAKKRMDLGKPEGGPYRPKNLIDYLERTGNH
jgi:hypothetical protein